MTPRPAAKRGRRRVALLVVRASWALAAAGVALILVKFFVADVYRVDSGSMRPTLFGGRARPDGPETTEWALVVYDDEPELERFDLAVMRSRDGSAPLVKRACGLPGETIRVLGGDLWIDGKLLPHGAPRPAPILVFDDRHLALEKSFHMKPEHWHREGEAWTVDGAERAPGSLMFYHPDLRDDYLDREHRRVAGLRQVNDAIVELELALPAAGAARKLRLRLVEEGDTFEVVLEPDAGGEDDRARVSLVRWSARSLQLPAATVDGREPEEKRASVLAETTVVLARERWIDLVFSNVDNHLSLRSAALELALEHDYAANEPYPGITAAGDKSIGPRVAFGAEDGRARFRKLRILRDLYYTEVGAFGVESPLALGPDEYFLLGDNSASSTDSRHFGPVHARELLGRPVAIVWPRPRELAGAVLPEP